MDIVCWLKEVCEYVGLFQEDVFVVFGVLWFVVSLIEVGFCKVDVVELGKFLCLFGCLVQYFLMGEEVVVGLVSVEFLVCIVSGLF